MGQLRRPSQVTKQKRSGKFDSYNPLNASREIVLKEACNLELDRLPSSVPNNLLGDQAKHCSYHKNQGHNRKECFKVKDLLLEHVRLEPLNYFISRSENSQDKAQVGAGVKGDQAGDKVVKREAYAELVPREKQGKNYLT